MITLADAQWHVGKIKQLLALGQKEDARRVLDMLRVAALEVELDTRDAIAILSEAHRALDIVGL